MSTPEVMAVKRNTVLVVDDTPETLSLLTDTLDQAGYTVLIALDGEAALELLDQVTPDLILMDALMPGISGFETCRRLKRDRLLAQLPVIFMTGLTETAHVVEGLASGAVDYVTKPIVLEELLARIRVHLGNARLAHETGAALDASGRFLLATDRAGRILWCTPKARQLLAVAPARDEAIDGIEDRAEEGEAASVTLSARGTASLRQLPAALIERLLRLRRGDNRATARGILELEGRRLECSFVSTLGPDEILFRLTDAPGSDCAYDEQLTLQAAFSLTAREGEVLLWISRGKSNRDIGEILGISPRTVNKHLEQVFVKLGVENRAAAAGAAVRRLAR